MTEERGAQAALPEGAVRLEGLVRDALGRSDPEFEVALDELVARLDPKGLLEACRILKEDQRLRFDFLRCLSGVDWVEHLELVYHLYSTAHGHKMVVKVRLPVDDAIVPSVTSVWRAADWHEREAAELFGITFEGHPRLEPLLLWEGFEGYPMRKSYPLPEIPEW